MSGDFEVKINTNAEECVSEISQEDAERQKIMVVKIRRGVVSTFARMIRTAPRLTGNYRANMRLTLEENPKPYRLTGRRAGLPQSLRGYRGHNKAILASIHPYYEKIEKEHIAEASAAFAGKSLSDIRHITIVNDAPHAHLVESGGTRNRAHWIFAKGQQMAEQALNGDN